jgi:hypothetical protein
MFKPQFAPAVEAGTKLQTVRPVPKRMPEAGDTISLRMWTGLPYRSKQRVLRESVIESVAPIRITEDGPVLDSIQLWGAERDAFAEDDGFPGWMEMREWFEATHGLPFDGILICWKPL